jgi:DNA-directed RNA polymerase specialized sigma24 family protein
MPTPLAWSEIYERLARRPERPDPLAVVSLERRVRAWTQDDDVAAETCAKVLHTFNLARGGAAFEGFVQGRFIEVAHEAPPPAPLPIAMERGSPDASESLPAGRDMEAARSERLARCLEELRARNPRHHGALVLLYEDRATLPEAADTLAVDAWTVRVLAARAKQVLAECLGRAERRRAERAGGKPGRAGRKPPNRRGPPRRRGT